MTLTLPRFSLTTLLLFATAFLLLFGFAAHAEYANELGPVPAMPGDDGTLLGILNSSDADQLAGGARQFGEGHVLVGMMAVVALLTSLVRRGLLQRLPGKVGAFFFGHPLVGYATPFGLAAVLAVLKAAAAGGPISWSGVIFEVVIAGLGAGGAFLGKKNVDEARGVGAVAAAAIDSKSAAVALLGKGPQD